MRLLSCVVVAALVALAADNASAQWFVRGTFNGWTNSTDPMIHQGGGHYTWSATGLTPGDMTFFKVTVDDWSENYPGSDARTMVNAAGEIDFHFYDNNVWADGWLPNGQKRVGYDDPLQFAWDLPGSMNGWSGGAAWQLANAGGGLYQGVFAMPAGTHQFKFRKFEDWNISIGDNFGNSAGDNSVTVAAAGDLWKFELDLPGGRFRWYQVPEPASAVLVGIALAMAGAVRRRK
jgi:hypothetical protein